MEVWNWVLRSLKFPSVSFSPRKSSYSSPSAASVGNAPRYDGALSKTGPRLYLSGNSQFVTRSKSEKLKAVADCRTVSYSADQFYSSWDEEASTEGPGSSSSTAVVTAPPPQRHERVKTGEIFPEIRSHSDGTVPPSLLNELEQVFKKFDANEDGKISSVELKDVLESLGDHTTDEEAMLMLKEVDANGDGYIDLDDFILMSTGPPDCTSSDELKAAFTMFDLNKEGYITADTLMQVLSSLRDDKYTLEECAKMIKEVDLDGDGRVNFEEFKRMMA